MSIPLYILKRLLVSIPTLLMVSIIVFTMMRFDIEFGPVQIPTGKNQAITLIEYTHWKNPIDPLANLRNNPAISRAALAKEVHRLGLDQPLQVQYWRWFSSIFQFHPDELTKGNLLGFFTPDLGKTFSGDEVTNVILGRAQNTLFLNLAVLAFSWLIAIPIGIYSALHWRSIADRAMTIFASIGMSLPSFVLALLFAMFAVSTGWFPIGGIRSDNFEQMNLLEQGLDILHHIAMPTIVLVILSLSGLQRQMRGNLLDVLREDYIRTARAKGLPENQVIYKHAVRTAINPLVTLMGYEIAGLLGGSLLVENVLNFPGLGQLMYKAVLETDTNLVMASLMMGTFLLVVGNLLADILLKYVDPRVEVA